MSPTGEYPAPKPSTDDPLYGLPDHELTEFNSKERNAMMAAGAIPPITRLERLTIDHTAALLATLHTAVSQTHAFAHPIARGLFANAQPAAHAGFLPVYENTFSDADSYDCVRRLCRPGSDVQFQTAARWEWGAGTNTVPTAREWADLVAGRGVTVEDRNVLPFVAPAVGMEDTVARLLEMRAYLGTLYKALRRDGYFAAHRFAHVLPAACWDLMQRRGGVGIKEVEKDRVHWHRGMEVLREEEERERERVKGRMLRNWEVGEKVNEGGMR